MVNPRPLPAERGPSSPLIVFVRVLCVLGAVSLIGVPLWFWLSPDWIARTSDQLGGVRETTVDERAQQLGAAASLLPVSIGLFTLWQLWQLFGQYALGEVFSRVALAHLRRFAWALLAAAIVTPLFRALMSVVLTLGNGPGKRMLVIGLSWNDYMALLLAVVLLAIATVMGEAVRLAEENESFV
jgi:Protein of unknown function (DUF2975)